MKHVLALCLIVAVLLAGCTFPAPAAAPTEPPATIAPTATEPPTDPPPTATEPPPTATLAPGTEAPTATNTSAASPTPATTDTPAASPTPAIVYITYKDFEILPRQVTIKVGTTVVFLIEAGILTFHQPYNFDAPNVFEGPSGMGNGTSWSYTFNEPGTITIRCGYHQEMIGTLIIEP